MGDNTKISQQVGLLAWTNTPRHASPSEIHQNSLPSSYMYLLLQLHARRAARPTLPARCPSLTIPAVPSQTQKTQPALHRRSIPPARSLATVSEAAISLVNTARGTMRTSPERLPGHSRMKRLHSNCECSILCSPRVLPDLNSPH